MHSFNGNHISGLTYCRVAQIQCLLQGVLDRRHACGPSGRVYRTRGCLCSLDVACHCPLCDCCVRCARCDPPMVRMWFLVGPRPFLHLLIIVFAVVVVLLAIIVVAAPFTIVVVDILISFYLFNVDSNWLLHNLCSEIDTTAAKGISHVDTGCCLGSFVALKSINKRRKLLLHNISLSLGQSNANANTFSILHYFGTCLQRI